MGIPKFRIRSRYPALTPYGSILHTFRKGLVGTRNFKSLAAAVPEI